MLHTLGLLLGCQLLGEITARGFGVAIPGPVLGLALLVVLLRIFPALAEQLRSTTTVILAHLSFLFVPAGVEHRFEKFTEDFKTWVIFYGAIGGE